MFDEYMPMLQEKQIVSDKLFCIYGLITLIYSVVVIIGSGLGWYS